jgi:hypothetical protein
VGMYVLNWYYVQYYHITLRSFITPLSEQVELTDILRYIESEEGNVHVHINHFNFIPFGSIFEYTFFINSFNKMLSLYIDSNRYTIYPDIVNRYVDNYIFKTYLYYQSLETENKIRFIHKFKRRYVMDFFASRSKFTDHV